MTCYVYLIEAQNDLIKIGCSHSPVSRLDAMRTLSPVMVRLIAFWEGGQADEADLHVQFAEQRHHNEWFAVAGQFASFVETVRGRGVERVPAWDELRWADSGLKKAAKSENLSRKAKERWSDPEFKWRCALNMTFRRRWDKQERLRLQNDQPPEEGNYQKLRSEVEREFYDRRAEFGCDTRKGAVAWLRF